MQVKDKVTGAIYIVAESRMSQLPSKKPKADTSNDVQDGKKSKSKKSSTENNGNDMGSYELLEKFPGSSLVGMKYGFLFIFLNSFSFLLHLPHSILEIFSAQD